MVSIMGRPMEEEVVPDGKTPQFSNPNQSDASEFVQFGKSEATMETGHLNITHFLTSQMSILLQKIAKLVCNWCAISQLSILLQKIKHF